jgi:hypothetical protein
MIFVSTRGFVTRDDPMSRVTLDADLRAKLNGLNEQVEVCDESGSVVGHFLPDELYWKLVLAADRCPYTVEELKQLRQATGGRTLAEIWKDLADQ